MKIPSLAFALSLSLASATAFAGGPHPGGPAKTDAPPVEETPAQRAAKLRDQGNEAMLGMRYADALVAYGKALELAPDEIGLHYSIARSHQFLGEYAEALASLEKFDKSASPEMHAKVPDLAALFAEIRPRVGTLNVSCDVPGARVLVRDKIVGVTPLPPTRLVSGAAILQIELDGYFVDSREVTIPGGGELALKVSLHPKSTSGYLTITTSPMGAFVSVDGKEMGTSTPKLELALPAGSHDILATRDGYNTARVPLVLLPGASRDLSIPLEPSRSILTRWWFWTGVGVAIVGGVALTYALTTERGGDHGTLTPSQVSGP